MITAIDSKLDCCIHLHVTLEFQIVLIPYRQWCSPNIFNGITDKMGFVNAFPMKGDTCSNYEKCGVN